MSRESLKNYCAYPGCANKCYGRYCEEHAGAHLKYARKKETPQPGGWSRGYNWRKSKAYKEEHPDCERCGRPAVHVHHVIPIANGGEDEEHNMMALCLECHERIHGKKIPTRKFFS